jgi:anti-sigma-K factor RskA
MSAHGMHIRDEQLLLYSEGELRGQELKTVSTHVDSCPQCATRVNELNDAFREFSQVQRNAMNGLASVRPGARSQLQARIAERALRERSSWRQAPAWRHGFVFATIVLLAVLAGTIGRRYAGEGTVKEIVLAEPNAQLTPGAVVPIASSRLCTASSEETVMIPAELKAKVLQMYGVAMRQAGSYEVDYLITPELGGATDIRNLWPEPYHDTVWNAHVKDQLEDRLHEMVCHGDVDLATAQRAISTDWIAAYRKYFHTEVPISGSVTSAAEPAKRRSRG